MTANPLKIIEGAETINWANFFIRFSLNINYIAAKKITFGNSLFALDCAQPGWAGDKIGIDTIIVRSVFDYNDSYPKGSVINSIVLFNQWLLTGNKNDLNNFISLPEYIELNSENVLYQTFEVRLTEAPSSTQPFMVDLTIKLNNNGEEYHNRTTSLHLFK